MLECTLYNVYVLKRFFFFRLYFTLMKHLASILLTINDHWCLESQQKEDDIFIIQPTWEYFSFL